MFIRNILVRLILSIIFILNNFVALAPAETFGWRFDGSGKFPNTAPTTNWTKEQNVLWKTSLPKESNASPIIIGNKIFICQEQETLVCLSTSDGQILWKKTLNWDILSNGLPRPDCHPVNGYSSPTPLSDGKYVYVLFGSGIAAAFNFEGKKIWARIVARSTDQWGHSASPILLNQKIILHMSNKVFAIDPKSGNILWSSPSKSGWGSPISLEIGNVKAILTPGGDIMRAHDGVIVATKIAKMPWTSPIVHNGVIYVIDEKGATAVKLPASMSNPLKIERLWSMPIPTKRCYASSIYHDGLLYNVTKLGFLIVLDAVSGEMIYEQRLPIQGTVYPSPCLAGNYLLVSSDSGKTIIIEPGKEYKEVGQNQLDSFRSCPIFRGKHIYVRTLKALYCIGEKSI